MRTTYRIGLVALAALLAPAGAAADSQITLADFEPDVVQVAGFELREPTTVHVEATGIRPWHASQLSAYAWILDAATREPVWVMEEHETDRVRGDRLLRRAEADVELPAGRYELYYFAGVHAAQRIVLQDGDWDDWRRWLRRGARHLRQWHRDDMDEDLEDALASCRVQVTRTGGGDLRSFDVESGGFGDALIRHAPLSDEQTARTAFRLSRDATLRIRALVELPDDWRHPADGGWITNVETGERVWEVDWADTRRAGGADKNRLVDQEVRLPKGDYLLTFGTDDSHSWETFNAAPPWDPMNWGIVVTAADERSRKAFSKRDLPQRGEPLLELTRARDLDFLQQAFRMKKKGRLHVLALGEYSRRDHEFADYGWIENAKNGEIVWEMTRRNTAHAGGAEKNRMFDGEVELPAGAYVAFYVTDDSHSYRHWNAGAPFDPASWGLTLWPGRGFDRKNFKLLDEREAARNGGVLVRMIHVGSHERLRQTFTLDKPARVRVYALGEGVDGRMYDYGYIVEKSTGDVVWEMTWNKTRPAGGARKNRVADREILLDAGTYEVFYETDGSHAFADWNDRRPPDARNWGITISLAGDDDTRR